MEAPSHQIPAESTYCDETTPADNNRLEQAYVNQRLEEIENSRLGWTQIRACLVAGAGFFTDAYDLFIINIASTMIAYTYYNQPTLPKDWDLGVKVSTSVGTLIGQLFFGWAGDRFGRKRIYGLELMLIIVGTFGSALSASAVHGFSVLTTLVIMRFIVGLGVGGDYPLSAVITAEYSSARHRGALTSAVFAMQGFGILASAFVSAIMVVAFKSAIQNDVQNLDLAWRLCLGIGAIPAIITIYYRLTMKETPRYEMDQARAQALQQAELDLKKQHRALPAGGGSATSVDEPTKGATDFHGDLTGEKVTTVATADGPTPNSTRGYWVDFSRHYRQWKNFKILFACSMCWFALDVAFYGINLNNGVILNAIGYSSSDDPYENLHKATIGNIIINLMGTVPGYWFTVFTIDRIGRRVIQIGGFGILTVLFIILGFAYQPILDTSVALFIVFFTLAQFFTNFGPNATTFVYPSEVFPTRFRTTSHGISAASGKLGAIVAQAGFSQLKDIGGPNAFINHIIQIFALFMLIGFVFSFLLPETKRRTLEEITGEDQPDQ
ncbi:hypothetical protein IWQ60_008756 [Tieghemiomyces parasiticus]|uniref:Major facilitator superfamily (MFS) profile domain-containing protein n=1 Tax=Tieghemiomyces parasiticus TaxID=78921 RepID=A0A9W7ZRJ0_9FUNG|nr:hypothetical protein IWQ60_008756 [Tieghemiomyces parasiticus]